MMMKLRWQPVVALNAPFVAVKIKTCDCGSLVGTVGIYLIAIEPVVQRVNKIGPQSEVDRTGFFENHRLIARKLQTLQDVGLGYIRLGQSSTTLSGGEAQRVKLATELSRRATGKTIILLDEPTTGLHMDDVSRLIHVLQRLTESGNTVLVVEHNLDVLKTSDYIIDLGPDGGDMGGSIVAQGTPEEVAGVSESYTGQYLVKAGIQPGKAPKKRKGKN